MTVRMNLWSLTLIPGEPIPLYVNRDFQITNAALAEDLTSETGRSVVKVTHNPISQSAFDEDSEFDSDSDDESIEGLEGEDDEEDSEDAEEQEGEDDEDEDDDEEDDDDEDMEEDSDDEEDDLEETSVLCSLTAGKCEQAVLNLTFVEGEVVIFEVSGENAVHLMGNYVNQFPSDDYSDSDSEYDSDDYDDLSLDEDEFEVEEFDEEDVEVAPKGKITEIPHSEQPKQEKAPKQDKKRKAEEEAPAAEELSKSQKKKLAKKAKLEEAAAAAPSPAKKEEKPAAKKESSKKTLPSGLIIEDVKAGNGPVAKPGKRLGMRYVGKLENGKQFDANTGGKPFSFVLGRGEVIAGWDQGLAGMAVGGERRLTIPAKLAYGKQRIPGIPPNSTLKFDVKLVSVN